MKTLYLIRHAKSSWEDPDLRDIERPLKGRGRKDALIMGARLRQLKIKPDLIISSPANRAYSTAKIIAEEVGYDATKIQLDEHLYFSGQESIMQVLRDSRDKHDHIFIFGHNPDFTAVANAFSDEYISNVPTAGLVVVEFNTDKWSECTQKNGKLKFFEFPKMHR